MPEQRPISHYDVLGVQYTASPEEIKAAYRARMAQYHPDRNRTIWVPTLAIIGVLAVLGVVKCIARAPSTFGTVATTIPIATSPLHQPTSVPLRTTSISGPDSRPVAQQLFSEFVLRGHWRWTVGSRLLFDLYFSRDAMVAISSDGKRTRLRYFMLETDRAARSIEMWYSWTNDSNDVVLHRYKFSVDNSVATVWSKRGPDIRLNSMDFSPEGQLVFIDRKQEP
jgi:hypothetical protein